MSLVNLENWRSGEMGITSPIHEALLQNETEKLFSMPTEDRSRSHCLKLAWIAGRFNLDMKSHYLVLRFVKHLYKVPGKAWNFGCWKLLKPYRITNHQWKCFVCDGWDDLGMGQSPEASVFCRAMNSVGQSILPSVERVGLIKPIKNSNQFCFKISIF